MTPAGVILAAGESRRMGTPKALLRLQGQTFLEMIHGRMRSAGVARVVVVVGAGRDRILGQISSAGIEWVVNEQHHRGQLSSLWCALDVLGGEDGAMVALVDHPLVETETYVRLIDEFREFPKSIVIPVVDSRRGHPFLFGSQYFGRFREAPLDRGARWVLTAPGVSVREVPVDDPGVRVDVDTPEQYRRLSGDDSQR